MSFAKILNHKWMLPGLLLLLIAGFGISMLMNYSNNITLAGNVINVPKTVYFHYDYQFDKYQNPIFEIDRAVLEGINAINLIGLKTDDVTNITMHEGKISVIYRINLNQSQIDFDKAFYYVPDNSYYK